MNVIHKGQSCGCTQADPVKLQEIEDALATPGTARNLATHIEEYGPSPIAKVWNDYLKQSRRREVQVCDMCGCAHYAFSTYMCHSCFDAVQGVHMARARARLRAAMERTAVSAMQVGKSFQRAAATMVHCGPPQSIGRVVRHLAHKYLVVIVDLECTGGLDRIRRMTQPEPQWPKFDLECMVDDTPVPPKRKNRGPAKRGEWWNRNT